ncbi:MAG: hypothetical protein L0287_10730 [Anaerolineae bacterium]|nr:hypothetical protein [Anaerolineae bacterium]MCI0608447.1 hypothetical protein [Anaerolineae bacterium]
MKKKFLSMLTVFLLTTLLTSTASAAPNIKLSGVQFRLSSLVAEGFASGLGNTDVTVELNASGIPAVTCTNQGGNQAPGQNPPKISASGEQFLVHANYTKNGRSAFGVETEEPQPGLTAKQMGCPNNTWTATIDFVFWTDATISVYNTATGALLVRQNYSCVTTRNPDTVSCTLK